jgi:hypothetical protein
MLYAQSVEDALPKDSDVRVFSELMDCFVNGRPDVHHPWSGHVHH